MCGLGRRGATPSLDERQEALRPLLLRRREELVGRGLFDDSALVHHQHRVGDAVREAKLMRHHDHRHPLAREPLHDVEHFTHHVAHTVLMMDEGRIVEEAPPDEFFSTPKEERTQRFLALVE